MAAKLKPGWIRPATILFASEIPANEKAFEFALAQAVEFHAQLILFHAYDTLVVAAAESTEIRYYDSAAAARTEKQHLEPLAVRAREAGVECEIVVRPGLPADEILSLTRERKVDRIVMGTHSPGPIGKLLVGSVAEAVLRSAAMPVFIVGPEAVNGAYRNFATRTVLCAVRFNEFGSTVAEFAAATAAQHKARLILQHVITPQERGDVLADRTLEQVENDLLALVPEAMRKRVEVESIVVPGDPTEELLFQAKARQADLIVLGAQGASAFAAVTRHGVVYKTLAHATCPVLTLSPLVLAECGAKANEEKAHSGEPYLAGVI
jgi:nucleotide-binding universal stress UspA family protein